MLVAEHDFGPRLRSFLGGARLVRVGARPRQAEALQGRPAHPGSRLSTGFCRRVATGLSQGDVNPGRFLLLEARRTASPESLKAPSGGLGAEAERDGSENVSECEPTKQQGTAKIGDRADP